MRLASSKVSTLISLEGERIDIRQAHRHGAANRSGAASSSGSVGWDTDSGREANTQQGDRRTLSQVAPSTAFAVESYVGALPIPAISVPVMRKLLDAVKGSARNGCSANGTGPNPTKKSTHFQISGHGFPRRACLLLGVKRTSLL